MILAVLVQETGWLYAITVSFTITVRIVALVGGLVVPIACIAYHYAYNQIRWRDAAIQVVGSNLVIFRGNPVPGPFCSIGQNPEQGRIVIRRCA